MIPLLLAVAGCVAGSDGPSPTDPHEMTTITTGPTMTSSTVTVEEGLIDYRNCLAERGVPIDEISLDGLGRPRMADPLGQLDLTDRVVLDAVEACAPHLSSGALDLTEDPELADLVREKLGAFAECVRAHGVDGYPDPVAGFDGVGSPFPVDHIPWTDPGLASAVGVCVVELETPSN